MEYTYVLRLMGEISQNILTQNKLSTYLFMHLYIQPVRHLVILREKKITLSDLTIVKSVPKFTDPNLLTYTWFIRRHTDLKIFIGLEGVLELQRAFQSNLFFLNLHCIIPTLQTLAIKQGRKIIKSNHNQT